MSDNNNLGNMLLFSLKIEKLLRFNPPYKQ